MGGCGTWRIVLLKLEIFLGRGQGISLASELELLDRALAAPTNVFVMVCLHHHTRLDRLRLDGALGAIERGGAADPA